MNKDIEIAGAMRKFININVLISYGKEYIPLILECLSTNNSEEKLIVFSKVIESGLRPEQKIFIIQKLLSLPKATRKIIAIKIKKIK